MANNSDSGATGFIMGTLLGVMTILGGPAGLIAGGVALAGGHAIGRAIRRNLDRKKQDRESDSSSNLNSFDYSILLSKLSEEYNKPQIRDYTNIFPIQQQSEQSKDSIEILNSICSQHHIDLNRGSQTSNMSDYFRTSIYAPTQTHTLTTPVHTRHRERPSSSDSNTQRARKRFRINEYGEIFEI